MKLALAVSRYVAWKHTCGYRFEKGGAILDALCRSMGDVNLDEVKVEHVLGILNRSSTSVITWRLRYWSLHRFLQHWTTRTEMPALLLPPPKPLVRQTFVPHVFTVGELKRLLEATDRPLRSTCRLDSSVIRTILLLLYGTGASIGEVVRIKRTDVDLDNSCLTIRSTRANRFRRIPVGPDVCGLLRQHLTSSVQRDDPGGFLFVTRKGGPLTAHAFAKTFVSVRRHAAVRRTDGGHYQPRIDDLRYTFAIHRITKWIEAGADLNRMLPALAAYMGQTGLGATERYLLMTPERFRKDLEKLSPARGRGLWRNNPDLMRFLSSL